MEGNKIDRLEAKIDELFYLCSVMNQSIQSPSKSHPVQDYKLRIKKYDIKTQREYMSKLRSFNEYLDKRKITQVDDAAIVDYLDSIKQNFR